jgi:hypothetical protein
MPIVKNLEKLNEFLYYSQKILKEFHGENERGIVFNYLVENSFRSYDLLVTIDLLNKSDIPLPQLEHPIGILLRGGLYDFINFQYVSNKSIKKNNLDSDVFEAEVREYMNGHFNKIPEGYELDQSLRLLDKYKGYGTKSNFKALGILKEGKNFAIQKKLNYLESAIEYWEWYSKYEHYGVFTNHMYNKLDDNSVRINLSVQLLFANIYLSLTLMRILELAQITDEDMEILEKLSLGID